MKNYMKGIITGMIIGAIIFSIPALADTIEAMFNDLRISVNGIDRIQWDENITLEDGVKTPASILYNGTTYLPMRKFGELSGNKIYWNGDSRTVGMTGAQKDIKVIAKKPDKNGNMWEYYTFKVSEYDKRKEGTMAPSYYSDFYYLGVKDEARGYERVYRLACRTMNVTDNEIYFLRQNKEWVINSGKYPADLVKLSFNNDKNSQDGEIIHTYSLIHTPTESVLIDKNYIFIAGDTPSMMSYGMIAGFNYLENSDTNGDQYISDAHWTEISNLRVIKSDDEHVVIGYNFYDNGGGHRPCEITFDKIKNKFSEPTVTGERVAPKE